MTYYEDFDTLKKDMLDTWRSMELLLEKFDWKFFTDEAAIQVEAYGILADAFDVSDDRADFFKIVAGEIFKREQKVNLNRKIGNLSEALDENALLRHLATYVCNNFPDEECNEYREFNTRYSIWGCI